MSGEKSTWVVMPFVDLWSEYTRAAAEDVLAQSAATRLILVSNGSEHGEVEQAQQWKFELGDEGARVGLWHYDPMLTLSQVWNKGLEMVWRAGGERALVVNNDLRLPRQLLEYLSRAMDETGGLFVSAINCATPSELPYAEEWGARTDLVFPDLKQRGGPDYSCFLISRACHERFPFDNQFTYCNDLDHHRRMMLAGKGLKIFSVCVPYLHFASKTITKRPELARVADGHRAKYAIKWGGPVNQERFLVSFGGVADLGTPVTTPELQEVNRQGKCCYRDYDTDGNCDLHPVRRG